MVAIFYPFSQFCEIIISLLSLQTQGKTAANLFQRGVEYGKYVGHRNIFFRTKIGGPKEKGMIILSIMIITMITTFMTSARPAARRTPPRI